ncbi:MAG: hypothetical protein P0Y53_14720 [Candidatus Pseudobacter hemicellulosilyticus]|uniref:DUF1640 domain-containing protein n=1 Tax=Candidatus Pseudobacter hemicellulosilyticus TaxID=3121375 RepID=A0AAJ6BF03_9BACT|nr:MAG: hypothetical protein P0Y53_14720 [Pseudobacter sp.]
MTFLENVSWFDLLRNKLGQQEATAIVHMVNSKVRQAYEGARQEFAANEQFNQLKGEFIQVKGEVIQVKGEVNSLRLEFNDFRQEMRVFKADMMKFKEVLHKDMHAVAIRQWIAIVGAVLAIIYIRG